MHQRSGHAYDTLLVALDQYSKRLTIAQFGAPDQVALVVVLGSAGASQFE